MAATRRAAGSYDGIVGLKVNLGPAVPNPDDQASRLLEIAALVAA